MSKNKNTINYLMKFTSKELRTVEDFFINRNKNFNICKEESTMNTVKKFLLDSIKIKNSFEKDQEVDDDYYKNEKIRMTKNELNNIREGARTIDLVKYEINPNSRAQNIESILLKISNQLNDLNSKIPNQVINSDKKEISSFEKPIIKKEDESNKYFQFRDQEGMKTDIFTSDLLIASHFKSIFNMATRKLYREFKFYYYAHNQLGFNSKVLNYEFDVEDKSINSSLSDYYEFFENSYRELVQRDNIIEVKQEYLDVNRLLTTDIWYINKNYIDYATTYKKIITIKTKEPYSKEFKIDCINDDYFYIIKKQFEKYLKKEEIE